MRLDSSERGERARLRGRVLVVDDERGPRQALRMLLKEEHDVILAESVADAQDIMQEGSVDLVITDLRMPRQTGVELLQWVKGRYPETQVIILTGYGQLDTAVKAVEYGAFAYLEKPFDSTAMLRYVQEGLERRHREMERRQMEELALEANRFETLGRFVSGMLHDLGTPLSVISSQVELMLLQPQKTDVEQRLRIMLSQVEHCSDIVRSTMTFLRHSAQEMVPININDVVGVCLEVAKPLFVRQRVEVRPDLAVGTALLRGDYTLVRQALLNLLTNACQAMENQDRPREVHVRTWNEFGFVCVSVGDTGPGVPKELRAKIFSTFYSTKGKGGTGLGLAVVQNVMRRHNGDVEVDEHDGGGAQFTLRFPVAVLAAETN